MARIWAGAILLLFMTSVVSAAELKIGTSHDITMDPHFMWTDSNVSYYLQIYGGLTNQNSQLQVEPGLAASWEPVSDTEWRFHLRKGVHFHDGSPLTAQDVVASYERMTTVKAAAPFTGAIAGFVGIKAIDDYTVDITTSRPNPVLPQRTALIQILPSKIAESATSEDFTTGRAVVGSGPYKFVSYKPGDSLVLERNPDYWGEPAKWDKVTFRFMTDAGARVAALLGHDVDMIDSVPPAMVARLKSDSQINVVTGPSSRTIYLTLDTGRDQTPYVKDLNGQPAAKNPYKDKRVREALSLAIDRQAIKERVLDGFGFPTGEIVPAGFGGYSASIQTPKYDVARAKQLLADAGYASGFGLTIHCPNDRYVEDARICQVLGQMFSHIGLKVDVQTMPNAVLNTTALDPNGPRVSLAMVGWSDSSGEALVLANCIHTPDKTKLLGGWNWGHYSNPKIDTLIEEAGTTLDTAKRHALLADAMAAAMDDVAVIPLHYQSVIVATRKGLTYKTWPPEYTFADSAIPTQN